MGKFLLICLFLCTGICKTSAQIVDLSKFVKAKKSKTEVFSQKLQNTRDSLLRICKIYKLEDFKYKFPTIYLGESMESLKAKSKEFEKIKVEIENAISKKELEQKRVDSIQKVNDAERIVQERIADSLYLIRAAQTWEWLHDKKGKWETIDRSYPKEEHYQVNSLFPQYQVIDQNAYLKGKWETIDRSYPKEEHYQVNSLFPQYQVIDQNAYLNGKLVGVCHPAKNNKNNSEKERCFRIDVMTFLCQQDFLNNKYEIQKESPKTQEYIKQKLGLKKQLEPTDSPVYKEMIANASKLRIAQERLRKGEIDLNTYNRIKTKLGAKFTGTVYQEMADSNSPEINAGKRYLEQLRTDNKSLIGEYTIQRIDGTNFTYQFRNNEGKKTFSVKVSFFVNEKKNVLYTISSLQKK